MHSYAFEPMTLPAHIIDLFSLSAYPLARWLA